MLGCRSLVALTLLLGGCHLLLGHEPRADQSGAQADLAHDRGAQRELAPGDRATPDRRLVHGDRATPGDRPTPSEQLVDTRMPTVPGAWVLIPAGSFTMGSPAGELCREVHGKETQHVVTLTRGFWMQTTEVLQTDFLVLRGYNPATFKGCTSCPVDNVSWHEAAAYCNALSQKEGVASCYACSGPGASVSCSVPPALSSGTAIYSCEGYRLPTEAEWEYAYRAGVQSAFYQGGVVNCVADPIADVIGWYQKNTTQLRPPAQKKPNAWQLFDLPGNLWEWCHDRGKDDLGASPVTDPVVTPSTPGATTNHAIRGGSWAEAAGLMRAAARMFMSPSLRGGTDGFRCVRRK